MAATGQRFLACLSHTPKDQHVAADSVVADTVKRIQDTSVISRSTKAYCRHCHAFLGDFYNSWYRVTGSYFVPALRGSYTSLLKESGRPKAASRVTDLQGCTIQPGSCPALCTDSPIGFVVVEAPLAKKHYRNRDFFKLSRIELRCEPSPYQSLIVAPLEDTSKDLWRAVDSFSPSPTPESTTSASVMAAVEMESLALPQGHHHLRQEHHRDLAYQQTTMQLSDNNAQPPASTATSSPRMPISRPNSTSNVQNQQVEAPSQRTQANPEISAPPSARASTTPGPPPDVAQKPSPHDSREMQRQQCPRSPPEVSFDAIQRLQTQISQNSGALAAHTRDIRRGEETFGDLEATLRREVSSQLAFQNGELQRVDGAVSKLHHEMQAMHQTMESLRRELHASRGEGHSQQRPGALPAQPVGPQDSALELMAQQIAVASHKANEVDVLKITIEIMKNKIQRLEEGGRQPPALGPVVPSTATRRLASTQQSPQVQSHNSFTTPATTATPKMNQHHEDVSSQSGGWATINSGVKRSHGNDADNLDNGHAQVPSSTKRPRLVYESAPSFVSSSPQPHTVAQDSQSQYLPHPQPLPSQPLLSGSLVSTPSQQSSHTLFATQDGPLEDSWRSASQRDVEHRPRSKPRGGGGPGSRGGSVRKSIPTPFHTPEWERDEWHGVPESQNSPDSSYNHAVRSTPGIARRGTGGGGGGGGIRRGFTPTHRSASMSLVPPIGFEYPADTYEHGKKTRTKPIRNADGVLIRKDGRPDMRSQSSAANLRKVHARREGDTEVSPSGTPMRLHDAASANATEISNPTGHGGAQEDGATSVTSKHEVIMGKMFPRGVDKSRKEHDYTRELFDKDHDHAIHLRTQAARLATNPSSQIKKEPVESHSMTDIQSRREEEVVTKMNGEKGGPGSKAETMESRGTDTEESPCVSPASHSESHDDRTIPPTQVISTC